MRLLKCIACIAIIYLLSPVNGFSEREIVDGAARTAIAVENLAPAGRSLAAMAPAMRESMHERGTGQQAAGEPGGALISLLAGLLGLDWPAPAPSQPGGEADSRAPQAPPGAARSGDPSRNAD